MKESSGTEPSRRTQIVGLRGGKLCFPLSPYQVTAELLNGLFARAKAPEIILQREQALGDKSRVAQSRTAASSASGAEGKRAFHNS